MVEAAAFHPFKLGALDVTDVVYDRITVTLDNRMIDIPREPFCDDNGVWGTAYDISLARYRDIQDFVPPGVAAILIKNLRLMHGETPCVFE